MNQILQILTLMCGMDYSGLEQQKCITQTEKCMQENSKAVLRRDEVKKMESQLFYKCYKQGAVEADKDKKKDTAVTN